MSDQAQEPAPADHHQKGERRDVERKPVHLPGRLFFDDTEKSCTVFDISPRGANISALNQLPINRSVRLKVTQNGEFVGRVVWRRGERMGLRFVHFDDEPILANTSGESSIRMIS